MNYLLDVVFYTVDPQTPQHEKVHRTDCVETKGR